MIAIRKIELPIPGIEHLQQEACGEGYDFIETLVEDGRAQPTAFVVPGRSYAAMSIRVCWLRLAVLPVTPLPGGRIWAASAGFT